MVDARFLAARDLLLAHRDDARAAHVAFAWPALETFNWAFDWFDDVAERRSDAAALVIVHDDGSRTSATFEALRRRSHAIARGLAELGLVRGDRLMLMLGNVAPLWEVTLAAMRLGVVIVPATLQLLPSDIQDRVDRGGVRHAIVDASVAHKLGTVTGLRTRVVVGGDVDGLASYEALAAGDGVVPHPNTRADEPLLLYFTSGTTAKPKLVLHTHASYPVGHLSTMYWIGLRPGDVHWNISSPGWAKHAWSNVFAPWNAEATVLVFDYVRFDAKRALELLAKEHVTTLCAPPTVWRMLILEDLASYPVALREIVAAGEPLNPEIIARVRSAWGVDVRDGFGQSETTAMIGNAPRDAVKPGSMGRPLPGYRVTLLADGVPAAEGEVCVELGASRPLGLMSGYEDDPEMTREAMREGHYHTGDIARVDDEGYITYVGRADDVFKASDYRISPFELESVLLEHSDVAEAAVVPSPDPLRLAVPKAFIALSPGVSPSADVARSIFEHVRERVAPYKRVRRLSFATLPKTVSGKIRRVELRLAERDLRGVRPEGEHRDDDWGPSGKERGSTQG